MTHLKFILVHNVRLKCPPLPIWLYLVFCLHLLFLFFFFFFWFFSWHKRDGLLYMHHIRPQLRTELVQNATGPGQRTNRDNLVMSKVGSRLSELVLVMIAPDPLRQSLDKKHAAQQLVPAPPPGLRHSLFLLFWPPRVHRLFTWTSASSFFFCASVCALASFSTWLSLRRGV
jgi:hypothetical protein